MELQVGSILEGKVTSITKFGAFVALDNGKSGLVHISEIANTFVNDVHDYLQEGQAVKVLVLRIPYAWVAHETADTIADCDVVSEVLGISICKNLFLCNRQKTAFYLLTMPGGKPFQTKVLSAQLGTTRLSFAPPELMESMLRCTPGSASVLGLAYDTERRVRLVMDRAVHDAAWFGCHPCKNDASLRLRTEDLLHVFLPHTGHDVTVVDL